MHIDTYTHVDYVFMYVSVCMKTRMQACIYACSSYTSILFNKQQAFSDGKYFTFQYLNVFV